jgi:hypothetical protein
VLRNDPSSVGAKYAEAFMNREQYIAPLELEREFDNVESINISSLWDWAKKTELKRSGRKPP